MNVFEHASVIPSENYHSVIKNVRAVRYTTRRDLQGVKKRGGKESVIVQKTVVRNKREKKK
jgi:hypothetical protein